MRKAVMVRLERDEMDEPRRAVGQERFPNGRVDLNGGRKPTNCRIYNITPRGARVLLSGVSRRGLGTCRNGAHLQELKS